MNIHRTFSLLFVLLLSITYIQGQQSIDCYKVICFYIGKNDFWRAYPVNPGGVALPGGLGIEIEGLKNASYYTELLHWPTHIAISYE